MEEEVSGNRADEAIVGEDELADAGEAARDAVDPLVARVVAVQPVPVGEDLWKLLTNRSAIRYRIFKLKVTTAFASTARNRALRRPAFLFS